MRTEQDAKYLVRVFADDIRTCTGHKPSHRRMAHLDGAWMGTRTQRYYAFRLFSDRQPCDIEMPGENTAFIRPLLNQPIPESHAMAFEPVYVYGRPMGWWDAVRKAAELLEFDYCPPSKEARNG